MRRRRSSKKKKDAGNLRLLRGIKLFNQDPKKGIEVQYEGENFLRKCGGKCEFQILQMLTTDGILPSGDAKAVADFLFREGRLSKKQIGQVSL